MSRETAPTLRLVMPRLKRRSALCAACTAAVLISLEGAALGQQSADTIQTVVGMGVAASAGDGGQATEAAVVQPRGATSVAGGGVVWAEPATHVVRRAGADGIVGTVAGSAGRGGRSGDGGPASGARLNRPSAAISTPEGVLIVDTANHRIRLVDAKGVIRTVAGTESSGYAGDGGPATAARLRDPTGISLVPGGGFLIADAGNHVVRRVYQDGRIATVAGIGRAGFAGDGGQATASRLSRPFAVAALPDGGFLVADSGNQRIRRVSADGVISTIAGTGTRGFSGDGGAAASAQLADPRGIAVLGGEIFIADTGNHRIRRIAPDGVIATFAGSGEAGFAGDGGGATSARLSSPESVSVTPSGGVLIADSGNNRIRFIGEAARPVNVARPAIVGTGEIGSMLAAFPGGWRGTGPAMSYRWEKCALERPSCQPIRGATRKTYEVRLSDFGWRLRVAVTATNAAGRATAVSSPTGVGRLERETLPIAASAFDGFVEGVVRPGSEPRVRVATARTTVDVFRRPLAGSAWETSVGVLLYDTRPLDDRLRVETAALFLRVLSVRAAGPARLLVHRCSTSGPTTAADFRAFPPGRPLVSVPLRTLRRGPTAIELPPTAISLDAPTKLCLHISGRVPRSASAIRFVAAEGARNLAAALSVGRRER